MSKQELVTRTDPAPVSFTFEQMQRMAVSVAKSGLFGVKDADQAMALMMVAVAENKHPALIARDYDIIQNRPAKKSEAMLRDFLASGGKVEWHELTDQKASATFSHPVGGTVKIDWDIPRAKQAGLLDKNGSMYHKYPRAMLRSRCVSEGCRTVAPSVTSGMYTPEEIRDIEINVTPVSQTAAIEQAVHGLTPDEVEAAVNSMDVETMPELKAAFQSAWRLAKERNDSAAKTRFQSVYEAMKSEIEAREVAEQKAAL